MKSTHPLVRRRVGAAVATVAAVLALAPVATAAVTPWAGTSTDVKAACSSEKIVTPFLPWGDTMQYTFAPNGGFEGGSTGWALTGSAVVVSGNETFFLNSKKDKRSLSLPAGSTATTPALCLGFLYPFARLVVSGPSSGSLKVELLYVDSFGAAKTSPVYQFAGVGSWAPSPQLTTGSLILAPFSVLGWTDSTGTRYTAVALRFTAVSGSWKLDDLYVDPFKSR
jgi:hypothetical protein